MVNINTLQILIKYQSEITSELEKFGETQICFYDALEGKLGILSKYKADLDQRMDEDVTKYLEHRLDLEENEIEFNHFESDILTTRIRDEALQHPYSDTDKVIQLFRDDILPSISPNGDLTAEDSKKLSELLSETKKVQPSFVQRFASQKVTTEKLNTESEVVGRVAGLVQIFISYSPREQEQALLKLVEYTAEKNSDLLEPLAKRIKAMQENKGDSKIVT
jgi:hypothetical protein